MLIVTIKKLKSIKYTKTTKSSECRPKTVLIIYTLIKEQTV